MAALTYLRNRPGRLLVLALGLFLVLATLVSVRPPEASAATPTSFACGDTIIADVTLAANVTCAVGFSPPGPNFGRTVVIGADNIVIDGNFKTFDYSESSGSAGLGTIADRTGVTIKNLTLIGPGKTAISFSGDGVATTGFPDLTLINNTVPDGLVTLDRVGIATIADNTITATTAGSSALSIANVPQNSIYSITNNTLTNPSGTGLNIGSVHLPGMDLTLEDNIFDGSKWGAILNNVKGPFTLSLTNSFAGVGHSGGTPLTISGVDLTVKDWIATTPANTLGTASSHASIQ